MRVRDVEAEPAAFIRGTRLHVSIGLRRSYRTVHDDLPLQHVRVARLDVDVWEGVGHQLGQLLGLASTLLNACLLDAFRGSRCHGRVVGRESDERAWSGPPPDD